MALEIPESMDELVYFTNRTLGEGKAIVWVERKLCEKCKKGTMGKPRDDKGKVKIRAKEFVCPECGYTVDKDEYEPTLEACCIYTCPECENKGEQTIPFKRKNIDGVPTLRFTCEKCGCNMDVTKKMKEKKEKKK